MGFVQLDLTTIIELMIFPRTINCHPPNVQYVEWKHTCFWRVEGVHSTLRVDEPKKMVTVIEPESWVARPSEALHVALVNIDDEYRTDGWQSSWQTHRTNLEKSFLISAMYSSELPVQMLHL
jgi:hypothetical protein